MEAETRLYLLKSHRVSCVYVGEYFEQMEKAQRDGPITYSAELLALTQPKEAVAVPVSISISQHAPRGQEQSQTYT